MRKITLYLLLIIPFFISCQEARKDELTLKVLATTDVHGALFPYDLVNDEVSKSSLAQAYTYISKERSKNDQSVLLLDNGDILQGDPVVYYSNFEKPNQKHICAEVMNFMAYDAGTVGNHDIEPGHEVYDRLVNEFAFPWMAANAVKDSDGTPYFTPYTIIEKEGVRIAVIGFITAAIPKWLPEKIWSGIHFEEIEATAKKWMAIVKEKEKPDMIIGLFHSGMGEVDGNESGVVENETFKVAKDVPGFDMIVCGHDHQEAIKWVENTDNKQVLIINPKSKAQFLADVTVSFKLNADKKTYSKKLEPQLIDVKALPVSKEFEERFKTYFQEVKDYVSRPVGRFTKCIKTSDAMFGDSPFVDLIQNIQLDLTGADVSFTAPLSFNTKIDSGMLYVRDLFKLYRFENLLYTMNLTGQEIKDFLEYSYDKWFHQMKKKTDPMLFIKSSEKGNQLSTMFFNYDSAQGIDYELDLRKEKGNRIHISKMSNGEAFDLNKTYKVALNSYRGNGGGGHLTEGAGLSQKELIERMTNSTTKDLRFYLMKWIEEQKVVNPTCDNNWTVSPEAWWKQAKEREYKLLYGNN
ncbi:bifunctional UDP-sugar hydrolase/5'-nucleotidase [Ancylomarina sp. 16SWW S1-10-2]|uniref:bifunctional metallophosphatase/5'-nucleotidase n=1 Tax=Ancylomarina sp. 16SWW S1-10-2 TaxID=2499681 RepID=UPI0012ADC8A4|nr:bifunctional UDP-sugar hydrolase/5'-nucleotidase [Ancylomarina sp. 16SWW S1-10-2]MRT92189.1 bifunctional metallophosphatase/5'-nucleotidase [Ancylomarina sp. 16SWW S1-10-2]